MASCTYFGDFCWVWNISGGVLGLYFLDGTFSVGILVLIRLSSKAYILFVGQGIHH
jgi:hypothetical protein